MHDVERFEVLHTGRDLASHVDETAVTTTHHGRRHQRLHCHYCYENISGECIQTEEIQHCRISYHQFICANTYSLSVSLMDFVNFDGHMDVGGILN